MVSPSQGGRRHAANVGDGQAHKHSGYRAGLLMLWHDAGRHHRSQAEKAPWLRLVIMRDSSSVV